MENNVSKNCIDKIFFNNTILSSFLYYNRIEIYTAYIYI